MPNPYVDRGIIKWAPFDALVGYHEIIEQMKHEQGKIVRPVLSDDQHARLNHLLKMALDQHLEVAITYYQNGYILRTFGSIRKIDWHKHQLILSTYEKIKAEDLMDMIPLEQDPFSLD